MLFLDTTTKSLEVLLGGAPATNQLPFVVGYVDVLTTDMSVSAISEADGVTNSGTAVTMVSAPAASHTRQLKFLSLRQADTAPVTATIRVNNNGTFREVCKFVLAVDDVLYFVDGEGFKVMTSAGALRNST